MTQLEIKTAREKLKTENTLAELYAERQKIDLKIETLERSLKSLERDPVAYFDTEARVKQYFG